MKLFTEISSAYSPMTSILVDCRTQLFVGLGSYALANEQVAYVVKLR